MLGTNTDPYQRAEGRYRLMPEIVGALTESGTPFSILTKGTLLRRDLPLLQDAAASVRVSLAMSIAVFDDALQHSVEPGTPTAAARLDDGAGGDRGGLPGHGVPDADPAAPHRLDRRDRRRPHGGSRMPARDRVVYGALHLRPGAKQWFMQWLQREHPELVSSYLGLYPGASATAPKAYRSWLAKRVRPLLRVHGLDGHAEDDDSRPRSAGVPGLAARSRVVTTSRRARAAQPQLDGPRDAASDLPMRAPRRVGDTMSAGGVMARFLVTAMPFTGHVAPLSAVAAALVARGHDVRFYTGSAFRAKVEATGATFVPWTAAPDFDENDLPATFPRLVGKKGLSQLHGQRGGSLHRDRPAAGRRPRGPSGRASPGTRSSRTRLSVGAALFAERDRLPAGRPSPCSRST